MSLLVMKFGGTSVGTAQRMKALVEIIPSDTPTIVVLSAMSGTTNALVDICDALYRKDAEAANRRIDALEKKYREVVDELYAHEDARRKAGEMCANHFGFIRSFSLDMFTLNEEKAILAQGELLSTALFYYYLGERGVRAALLPALNFMRIDGNEEPDLPHIEKQLKAELGEWRNVNLFITQGYICRNAFGEIDNLKRGGSDYTASIVGAVLDSPEIQIWTDIDGMHNNDPRVVEGTRPVERLSFDEAAELAYFGAKILHPTCILPAKKRNIPVRLKNTMQPEAPGTIIANTTAREGFHAIAAKDGITAINIKSDRMLLAYGFLRAVFEIFERYKTPIDMISTSEVAVSVTIDNNKNLDLIVKELKEIAQVEVDQDQAIICIVGLLPKEKAGYAQKVFDALTAVPLRMVSYGGSNHNISVLVNGDLKKKALQALHAGLFNSN